MNLCTKKWGSPSSFRRKRPVFSQNCSVSSSEGARACVHANHGKNDVQKGCTMQLKGITLSLVFVGWGVDHYSCNNVC